MKNIALLTIFSTLLTLSQASANDLAAFGLGELEPITTEQSSTVRGQGLDSVGMAVFQIFAFDYVSGSSINLQSSSVNTNLGLHLSGFDLEYAEPLIGTNSNANLNSFEIAIDGFTLEASDLSVGSIGSAFFIGAEAFETEIE